MIFAAERRCIIDESISHKMTDIDGRQNAANGTIAPKPRGPTKAQQMNKLYALPSPLRTFPLPTFVPHNPISILQLLYAWVSQTVNPPSSHPERLYQGLLSPETRSVHVTDVEAINALWQQGFYGKGNLSRSEPSWLDREKRRRGTAAGRTAEEATRQRRLERQQAKWERARKEREAIDQKLLEEGRAVSEKQEEALATEEASTAPIESFELTLPTPPDSPKPVIGVTLHQAYAVPQCLQQEEARVPGRVWQAPVGPLQLLALPNSSEDSSQTLTARPENGVSVCVLVDGSKAPVGPAEILALPNSTVELCRTTTVGSAVTDILHEDHVCSDSDGSADTVKHRDVDATSLGSPEAAVELKHHGKTNGNIACPSGSAESFPWDSNVSTAVNESSPDSKMSGQRRKSVRFSPTVEQTTFSQQEPPSPELAATRLDQPDEPLIIHNEEHLQLTLEEALFLSYGLGVLTVLDPRTKVAIPQEQLFSTFRRYYQFLPSNNPIEVFDDPFTMSYVVYHHFRSLGWVVRGGTKFGVDYLLYNRGPVFSHAEFAVLVLPSYSDSVWSSTAELRDYVAKKQSKRWSWLHCVNRVNSQVKKTVVLVYVDIPPPTAQREEEMGLDGVLKRYKVREFVLKRWLSNRMRD
jgi:tRNA-splicing endonuclease subunit Sen2